MIEWFKNTLNAEIIKQSEIHACLKLPNGGIFHAIQVEWCFAKKKKLKE